MTLSHSAESRPRHSALLRLLALALKDKPLVLRVFLGQIAVLLTGLAVFALTGLGIDFLRHTLEPGAKPPHWPGRLAPPASWSPTTTILVIATLIAAAAILRAFLAWKSGVQLAELVHRRVTAGLQVEVFAKLQRLDFRFFDHNSRGSIINRATGDIAAIRNFVETALIQSLVTALTVVVYVVYMGSIHLGLTLACLATVPVMWVASLRFGRKLHPMHERNRTLFDRMVLTLAESIEGVGVIRGFGRDREIVGKYDAENGAVKQWQREISHRTSFFMPGMDLLMQTGIVTLLAFGGKLVVDGKLPLGAGLVVFAGLLQQFANQVGMITQIAHSIPETLTGAERVFEILDAGSDLPVPSTPATLPPSSLGVAFEHVSFRHIETGPSVLRDVSFAVKPGECVAIVGETGSGKTALLNLIPRFYDPGSGRVLIGGVDARTLDPVALRRRIGMVFQENFLFSDTVAANIAFGRPDATREEIEAVAKIAAAHDFVTGLPRGYDTVLGEIGVDLSGGQRQRLTIARALLLNPDILLLDDPTAAIDPETEHEILSAIERALTGRTTFVVAHRLGTLRRADRILVLEKGRIVQTGRHDELLRAEGPYRTAALHQMVAGDADALREEISHTTGAAEGANRTLSV